MEIKKTRYDLPGILKTVRRSVKVGDKIQTSEIDVGPGGTKKKLSSLKENPIKYQRFDNGRGIAMHYIFVITKICSGIGLIVC